VPIRRIAVALACLAVGAVIVVALIGGDDEPAPTVATPAPTPTPTPVALDEPTDRPSLAVGITEPNANLISAGFTSPLPSIWERRRDELADIRPQVYRFVVLWSSVQPRPAAAPNLALENGGCSRTIPPCAPWAGIRDELRALAARQRLGGWEGMMVISGMPPWAAGSVQGCRRGTYPTAAGPRPAALPAYRRLIADVLALARSVGASIRYVSPWNEPNHPFFLAPQRAECDAASPSLAPAPYAALASAARAELAAQPGDQRLVLGETAGILEPTARATSVGEFIRGLPRGLVCGTTVWSQHGYIGGTDPVAETAAALAAWRCPRPHAIWITETGVGPAPGGLSLARGITSEAQGCRLLHQRLLDWYRDRQVTVAVQYTFREDEMFPTGLVTADLSQERPALREWQAWGDRPSPSSPPPRSTCRGLEP
jgi:hypothetical protein